MEAESLTFVIQVVIVFMIIIVEILVITKLIREFAGILAVCKVDPAIVHRVVVVSPEVVVSVVHSFLVESFVLRFLSCLQMYKK